MFPVLKYIENFNLCKRNYKATNNNDRKKTSIEIKKE
jgi:hypothetical protein